MNAEYTGKGLPPIEGAPALDGSDCVACGRCCHHGPNTVHLLENDEVRMGRKNLALYTEVVSPYFRFIKNNGEACGALSKEKAHHYPCMIYEVRPEDCRLVEAGSPCCLEARALGHLGSSVEFKVVVHSE